MNKINITETARLLIVATLCSALLVVIVSSVFVLSPDALSWLNHDGLSYTKTYWMMLNAFTSFVAVITLIAYLKTTSS